MTAYHIAFWNVENLFDIDGAPERPDWLQRRLARELAGWDEAVLARKIEQLAAIVRRLNDGRGPDLLGVCEVESRSVLERLAEAIGGERRYRIAHHDMRDLRGIDVAFLYDEALFEAREQFSHEILKRAATRDLFQVNFAIRASGRELIAIGNHWPARSGGVYETEPYRILAGETLSYWLERIAEIKGANAAILVMGDFNDEPFDRALVDYALSSHQRMKVLSARTPRLFNLSWQLLESREGTHYFDNTAYVLDQVLIGRGLLPETPGLVVDEASLRVERFPEMVSGGAYPGPIRFGRPASGFEPDGFSDHYPVSLRLIDS